MNSPGKGGGKSNDKDASAQPGSGIGRQDGSKDVRAAQQEKAMGKLSEVIGKRSANVSGEMTVEVQSGSQQLKTGYTQKSAQHAATGGDVSRDEVPLDLQPYVSGYFDEIPQGSGDQTSPVSKRDRGVACGTKGAPRNHRSAVMHSLVHFLACRPTCADRVASHYPASVCRWTIARQSSAAARCDVAEMD